MIISRPGDQHEEFFQQGALSTVGWPNSLRWNVKTDAIEASTAGNWLVEVQIDQKTLIAFNMALFED